MIHRPFDPDLNWDHRAAIEDARRAAKRHARNERVSVFWATAIGIVATGAVIVVAIKAMREAGLFAWLTN